ncbi:hypothetical protein MWU65_16215 [Cellulophaga sp. F20128]|uniref:hypothetical protein n=1 Tax=Cellulophaga sp. F20128 TaxID=2926413 RepID=UPI001FF1D3F7|nr:hypothetical protein [Cellulophaga sp. F20128]MCK0158738.1 hypothetical protein [Cellulophaga sp. F20128]
MKTILVDAWNTFVTEEGIDAALEKILDSYPNPKIILTNATQEECITYGILNMPYEVFSLEHRPNKTDKAYYIEMLDHFNIKATDVLYFEHNLEAVNAALSVGIKTYHYRKNEDAMHLNSFLKENL